ncbi:2-keto-4-pentenoate hydratase [Spirosomataceae bacterium TFI 002]|nr:2-keto-4-pentenoate hydratase [Spirosomataceae bacterium TFI 002]
MKNVYMMLKNVWIFAFAAFMMSCGEQTNKNDTEMTETEVTVDSLLHFRNQNIKTDYLSRNFPDLEREKAAELQLAVLKKELDGGAVLAGWKMGGTVGDSASFDPLMGYMLKANEHFPGDKISIKKFPGSEVMIEGEVGFVFKQDFPNGVTSIEELKNGIDYAVGAIEFAQSNAIGIDNNPETANTNHVLAFGLGQAGFLLGNTKIDFADFNVAEEAVECFIDGEKAASGVSSRIYGGHLNALNALVNMLPKYGLMIKKGDVVITGSMYANPTVTGSAKVNLQFSSLGEIQLEILD